MDAQTELNAKVENLTKLVSGIGDALTSETAEIRNAINTLVSEIEALRSQADGTTLDFSGLDSVATQLQGVQERISTLIEPTVEVEPGDQGGGKPEQPDGEASDTMGEEQPAQSQTLSASDTDDEQG